MILSSKLTQQNSFLAAAIMLETPTHSYSYWKFGSGSGFGTAVFLLFFETRQYLQNNILIAIFL